MKKISLNFEDLGVQSFETTPSSLAGQRGTVHGRAETWEQANSCHATFCACGGGTTGDFQCDTDACPSVNVINCVSALMTDCCNGGGGRATDYDDYGWIKGNCT